MCMPNSCCDCPFYSSCDTAIGMNGCQFYAPVKKVSFFERLKTLFWKLF